MKKLLRLEYGLSALSGILFTLPFLSEHLSLLAWASLVPLFQALRLSPGKAFKTGLVFGFIASYAGHYWLVGTLTRFGGFPIHVSFIFIIIYCLYLGVQYALFSYFINKFKLIQSSQIINLFIACSLWVAFEQFYPAIFPYGIGNTQAYNLKIIQVSDLLGVSLLSFIIVFFNLTIYFIIISTRQQGRKPVLAASLSIMFVALLLIYGSVRVEQQTTNIAKAEKINVGVVQGNFDFFEKTEENSGLIIEDYKKMSATIKSADLIIWPEASVQKPISSQAKSLNYSKLENIIPKMEDTYFLAGAILYKGNDIYDPASAHYNSAILTDWNGNILGKYSKNKLLLFGEYLPLGNIIPWSKYIDGLSEGLITPGTELNILNIKDKGIKIGTLICYEDLMPGFSRRFALKGANILVNLTDDVWFGRSAAPHEHLLVSIPRAVETRRYLIRSTNTGVSAIITPLGEVRNRTEIFKKEVFTDQVALLYSNTLYMKTGDIFPWICLISVVLFVFNKHLRKRYS